MTRRLVFAIPGDLSLPTGGYAYDRRMIEELGAAGWTVELLSLGDGFPFPDDRELAQASRALARLADGTLVLVDGLAFGAIPEIAQREAARLRLVALVHHPLALETGLDPADARTLKESETLALGAARRVVTTSGTTAATLAEDFAVPASRIGVAPPGTEPGPPARGDGEPPLILSVGALIPRKGHDILVAALARIVDLDWQCRIVGSAARDCEHAAAIRRAVGHDGLEGRIALIGETVDVRAEMASADLFVLPTLHEGYGMVFAEAMSQGLPIVGCAVGAVPEVVPEEAGLLVPPGDVAALAEVLRSILSDRELRRSKAAGALAAGTRLPDWPGSARRLACILEEASA